MRIRVGVVWLLCAALCLAAPKRYGSSKYWTTLQENASNIAAADTYVPLVSMLPATVITTAGRSDGKDVCVTDVNGTLIPRQVHWFDKSTPRGYIIYRCPAVSATTGGTTVYVQWGGVDSIAQSFSTFQDTHGGAADFEVVYTGNEASGNITDWSGNGYTGTASGVDYGAAARVGTGLDFEAGDAGDDVQNTSAGNFERTQTITSIGWVNIETMGCAITGRNNGTDAPTWRGWDVGIAALYMYFYLSNTDVTNCIEQQTSSEPFTSGSLQHFGFTYDGSSLAAGIAFYHNGSPVAKAAPTRDALSNTIINTAPFRVGSYGRITLVGKVDGILNYVRVVKAALSANQITTAYNNEANGSSGQTWGATARFSGSDCPTPYRGCQYRNGVYRNDQYRSYPYRQGGGL